MSGNVIDFATARRGATDRSPAGYDDQTEMAEHYIRVNTAHFELVDAKGALRAANKRAKAASLKVERLRAKLQEAKAAWANASNRVR